MTLLSRRRFVGLLAAAASPLAVVPPRALALPQEILLPELAGEPRTLSFSHLHTGERLGDIEYFSAGSYLPDALGEINHLLRDFRTGDVGSMDPALLDLLHELRQLTGSTQPFQIISGYRSPATNEALRARSGGVARHSLHMEGQAIDIRLGDVPLPQLRAAALSLARGGVGYYPASNFVHVDTGRVRSW